MDSPNGALVSGKSIGLQATDYKIGDNLKLVIRGYGGFDVYHEGQMLNPLDRLVEVEIKSLKKVKVEYIEA